MGLQIRELRDARVLTDAQLRDAVGLAMGPWRRLLNGTDDLLLCEAADLAGIPAWRSPISAPARAETGREPPPGWAAYAIATISSGLDEAAALTSGQRACMIWAILAAVGVPLWLCAVGILTVVMRNRALRARPGNVPVRVRPEGKSRWMPGHGLWVNNVFAYRGSPAAWKEGLFSVTAASERPADAEERKHLRRIGDEPVIATLTVDDAGTTRRIDVAARASDARTLLGPYAGSGLTANEMAAR